MKAIDNFETIYNLLCKMNMHNTIKCNNEYYVISILKRFKDIDDESELHTEHLKEDDLVFKTFIITDLKDILKYKNLITYMCDKLKCRAYITSSPRTLSSFNRVLLANVGSLLYDYNLNYDVSTINYNNIIDKSAKLGNVSNHLSIYDNVDSSHIYVIDIDKNIDTYDLDIIKNKLGDRYIDTYKTPNGYHVLSYQYDAKEFTNFIYDKFHITKETSFIEQKGKGCRMLLYANVF